mgnify:CR=1 FL=1
MIYNRSEERLHRFKKILVNQMVSPHESDWAETFLDLVSKLNETQIEILVFFRNHAEDEPEDMSKKNHRTFGLSEGTYLFYIQDLISKSLLFDDSINRYGTRPSTIVAITELGKEFLGYIERC